MLECGPSRNCIHAAVKKRLIVQSLVKSHLNINSQLADKGARDASQTAHPQFAKKLKI